MVTNELTTEANSDSFISFVSQKIDEHINSNNGYKHPYVFIHGIGKMFPYLRTNVFLTRYEKYNDTSRYKSFSFIQVIKRATRFLFLTLLKTRTPIVQHY